MRWRSDQAVGIDFDTGGKQKTTWWRADLQTVAILPLPEARLCP